MKAAVLLASLAAFAAAYPASTASKTHTPAAASDPPAVARPDHNAKSSGAPHPSGVARPSDKPFDRPAHSGKPSGRPSRPFGGPRTGRYEGSHNVEHGYDDGNGQVHKEHGPRGYGKPSGYGGYGDHGGHGGDKDDWEHHGENDAVPCTKNSTGPAPVATSTQSFEIPGHPFMDITAAAEIPLPTSIFVSSDSGSTLTISVTNSKIVTLTRSTRASDSDADEAFDSASTSTPAPVDPHHGTQVMSISTSVPIDPHHGTHIMSRPTWVPLHPLNGTDPSNAAPNHMAQPTRPLIDIDGMSIDDREPDFDSLTPKHFDDDGHPVPRPNKPANSSVPTTSTWANANGPHSSAGVIKPTPPSTKPDDDAELEEWFDGLTPKVFDESGHPVNHTKPVNGTKPPSFDHLTPEVYDEFGNPSNGTKLTNFTVPWKPHHPGAPFLNTTMTTSTIAAEPTEFTILPVPLSINGSAVPILPSATTSMAPTVPLSTAASTVTPNLARESVVPYGEIDRRDPHCETKCDRTYRACLADNCDAWGAPHVDEGGLLAPCAQVCITHTCLVSPEFACRKLCGYEGQCGGPTPFVPFLLDHKDIVYESLVSQWPEQLAPPKDEMVNEPGSGGSPVS